jgi:hypothetical protein
MVAKSLTKFNPIFYPEDIKPSLLARVCYFIALIAFTTSCTSFVIPVKNSNAKKLEENSFTPLSVEDYSDYLFSLKNSFLETPGIKAEVLHGTSKVYVQGLLNDILAHSEIFFKRTKSAEVTIIESEVPLHFSLSKGEIFLSTGLIAKYIKHESMLVSILSYELVRSEKLVYPKGTFLPIGTLSLEKMLYLGKINIEEKMEVHKWAHHVTVRSGYDGEYYLSWLQTQNRNTADFFIQVGDVNQINREESLFKAFLIKNTDDNIITKANSSKNFYTFLNRIRDGVI